MMGSDLQNEPIPTFHCLSSSESSLLTMSKAHICYLKRKNYSIHKLSSCTRFLNDLYLLKYDLIKITRTVIINSHDLQASY